MTKKEVSFSGGKILKGGNVRITKVKLSFILFSIYFLFLDLELGFSMMLHDYIL